MRPWQLERLEERALLAAVAQLVDDDIPGGAISIRNDSSVLFSNIVGVGSQKYFIANDGSNGQELWRINSAGIAEMVEDSIPGGGINPGAASPNSGFLANVNGVLYFNANDGTHGNELWRVGTSGIAEIVEDSLPGGGINPGAAHSSPGELTNVNGVLYFVAGDGVNGRELWRVNGSGIAEIVEDGIPGGGIRPGSSGSYPSAFQQMNGTLYFVANDGSNGSELWFINGSGVAQMVEDSIPGGGINPGAGNSSPQNLTEVGSLVYFSANDGNNGFELWRVSSAGHAEMVEDSLPGGGVNSSTYGAPGGLTNVLGTLYFTANDGTNGLELWRVNGLGVAEIVEDSIAGGGINPGGYSAIPEFLTNVSGTLYFSADDGVNGTELWRISGSGIAEMVEDNIPGGGIASNVQFAAFSRPRYLTNVSGTLFFNATNGLSGYELWRVNASGIAEIVEDAIAGGGIYPGSQGSFPRDLFNANGTLYFRASDGVHGEELWRAAPTGPAEMVEDSMPGGGIHERIAGQSFLLGFATIDGTFYFSADDGINGIELWYINSSGVAEMVEDSIPGGGINPVRVGADIGFLTEVSGALYFSADDGPSGRELWRIGSSGLAEIVNPVGGSGGVTQGVRGSYPQYLANVNGLLYFSADDQTNGRELWRVNTAGFAEMVEDAMPGGGINPGFSGSFPSKMTGVGNAVYFSATDATNGGELWRINSSGIAELVEDNVPGGGISQLGSSNPANLINVNGTLYFTANQSPYGAQIGLWRVNSSGIAEQVDDNNPGPGIGTGNSNPVYLTVSAGTLYFSADDGINGRELWRVNSLGIAEMIEDIVPGGGFAPDVNSSYPRYLTDVNGSLYFTHFGDEGINGTELWRVGSTGTAQLVEDAVPGGGIRPGSASSYPRYMANINGTLYFSADDGTNGRELWRVNSSGMAEMIEDAVPGGGIAAGTGSSNPSQMTRNSIVNGILYFSASDSNGTELWRINSSGVAEIVEDSIPGGGIRPGSAGSGPFYLTNVDGQLFFSANDFTNGSELWTINSSGIAELTEDSIPGGGIRPGSFGSEPRNLININNVLYFTANDGTHGRTLWRATPGPATEVTGAFVYHRDSAFDSSGVVDALDTVKTLAKEGQIPQTLTFDNLINSSRGINGLVFEIANLPSTSLTAADFEFQMSPQGAFDLGANPPATWQAAPSPSEVTVDSNAVSRVTLKWPNQSITNRWLRVTLLANSNTGLEQPEVYYLGHLRGETTGLSGGIYTVAFSDITPIRSAVGQTVGVGSIVDIDKNGTVAFSDISVMRDNIGAQLTNLTIPASSGGAGFSQITSGVSGGGYSGKSSAVISRWSELGSIQHPVPIDEIDRYLGLLRTSSMPASNAGKSAWIPGQLQSRTFRPGIRGLALVQLSGTTASGSRVSFEDAYDGGTLPRASTDMADLASFGIQKKPFMVDDYFAELGGPYLVANREQLGRR